MAIRVTSYLAPSVPARLFEGLAAHLGTAAGVDVELAFDPARSGPRPGEHAPFTSGRIDLAFMCATSYVWLTSDPGAPVELLGAAWVPADPRSAGRPVYFADVLARSGGPTSLEGLPGRAVAYNDDVSLSGYHGLVLALAAAGIDPDAVDLVCSGSHLDSLALLCDGEVDAAAIDSTVWRRWRRAQPARARGLRWLAALGPYPVQPAVVRADLPAATRQAVRAALLGAADDPAAAAVLADAGFDGFVAVGEADYAPLRAHLTGSPPAALAAS